MTAALFLSENTAHASFAACPRVDNVGSGTTSHPHFCDCCGCLNGPGGLVLPGAGVVVVDSSRSYGAVAREFAVTRRYLARKRRAA